MVTNAFVFPILSRTLQQQVRAFLSESNNSSEAAASLPAGLRTITGESWTTAGVVVSREVRKSANGKDYLIWKLHDLKDCQQPPVMLLLFGEAYKEYWKLQVGICVALMTPMIADQDKNPAPSSEKFKPRTSRLVLKVFKPVQVVELGYSSDLGSFNSVTSHPPPQNPNRRLCSTLTRAGPSRGIGSLDSSISLGIIRPTQTNVIKSSELKTTTKSEEKETLKKIMNGQVSLGVDYPLLFV
ncbi:unnamed protein product [Haemonchus placei]|uniref:DUF1336 domain-containing protein n=1 Tax=Haemonchus placei TaxID=6290 RepID=A0A0N4XA53_HAEPC|nr:unnamed protein product [Haemonchus placei]